MTIKTREDLEQKVLEYSPKLRERVESGDPRARSELEKITEEQFAVYKPFIGGKAQKAGAAGHALGYLGDVVFWGSAIAAATNPLLAPYMLTGLLLKKGNLAAQLPEATKTIKYMAKTHDIMGGVVNLGAKAASYFPGLTFVDRGLSRIAQRRMVKKAVYETEKALEIENKPWHLRYVEEAKDAGYTEVRDRSENIVRPNFTQKERPRIAA
jgi:hypothetical protein